MPRPFSPREFFGFAGQPLAVAPEAMPLPDQVRERFKRNGMEPFVSYVDPYATIARANQYRRANTGMQIADAEDAFVNEVGSGKTGFQEFLQKNPMASFSPMVAAYQKVNRTRTQHDPYEAQLAREGSIHLDAYRHGLEAGMDPTQAFSRVRDAIIKEKEAKAKHDDDELFFVKEGGDLSDLPALQAKGASRAQMLDFVKKKGKPLGLSDRTRLAKLQSAIDEAGNFAGNYGDDEAEQARYGKEAMGAFAKAHPDKVFNVKSKDDWDSAYAALKEEKVAPAQEAYNNYLDELKDAGMRVPGMKNVPHGMLTNPNQPPKEASSTVSAPAAANEESTAQRLLREARERRAGR